MVSGKYSDILSGILPDIYCMTCYLTFNTFWHSIRHSFWDVLWHSSWHTFWHTYLAFYLAYKWQSIWHSWHSIWHFIWHSTWHSIWHTFWHSIWHPIWHSIWHSFWHCIWYSIWHIFWHSIWHIFWHSTWHIFWHSFWHFIWHIFWHSIWHSIWHSFIWNSIWHFTWHIIYSGILSGVLSSGIFLGIYSGILLGIYSGTLSGILFGILSGILSGGWGPAVPTGLGRYPVEVQRCPLGSGGPWLRSSGVSGLERSRLRSSGAHWDRKLAVEVQRRPLGSGAGSWGAAVPTAIRSWRGCLKSNNPHLADGEAETTMEAETIAVGCDDFFWGPASCPIIQFWEHRSQQKYQSLQGHHHPISSGCAPYISVQIRMHPNDHIMLCTIMTSTDKSLPAYICILHCRTTCCYQQVTTRPGIYRTGPRA